MTTPFQHLGQPSLVLSESKRVREVCAEFGCHYLGNVGEDTVDQYVHVWLLGSGEMIADTNADPLYTQEILDHYVDELESIARTEASLAIQKRGATSLDAHQCLNPAWEGPRDLTRFLSDPIAFAESWADAYDSQVKERA